MRRGRRAELELRTRRRRPGVMEAEERRCPGAAETNEVRGGRLVGGVQEAVRGRLRGPCSGSGGGPAMEEPDEAERRRGGSRARMGKKSAAFGERRPKGRDRENRSLYVE